MLGVNAIRVRTAPAASAVAPLGSPVFTLTNTKYGVDARAQHRKLIADGSIEVRGGIGVLTRDVPFGSPSTAAAVALGRSSNGRIEWKSPDGGTYGDWENRGVE